MHTFLVICAAWGLTCALFTGAFIIERHLHYRALARDSYNGSGPPPADLWSRPPERGGPQP